MRHVLWLAVVFALASASTTALSTSTQHLAAGRAPDGAGPVALVRFLVRRPEWLLALLLGPVGFTFHVLALHHGPIGLVQPIAIMGIVLAVPVRAALARSWPHRAELVAVAVTAAALAGFLLSWDVAPVAGPPAWLPMLVGTAGCVVATGALLAVAGAVRSSTGRAFLLGSAAGILFGVMAVLIEVCQLYAAARGTGALATTWLPYALVAAGTSGIAVNQLAYRSARLSASMPVLNVVNCLLAIGFAYVVLHEVPQHTPFTALTSAISVAAMAWGLWRLTRLEESTPAVEPAEQPVAA